MNTQAPNTNETDVPDTKSPEVSNQGTTYRPNRETRRRGLSKAGRRIFLNKDGTKLISTAMQAKGAFGSPKGKAGFVTKYSADMHKWVDPAEVKPKKSKKPTLKAE